ncbi:cytochrome p450 cyp749a22 [Quercus suber]|uniref:Cytochrome p450 cyp749a22 n=1 Tax=Quercus suber TaxID=58331 RepID=A0AAW0J777_QUESU
MRVGTTLEPYIRTLSPKHGQSTASAVTGDCNTLNLLDECKTFYIASQETTSTLLGWTIFLLAIHTDWQEEARKEVLNLFGQQNPNPDGITKLKTARMS